jgi:DNA-binding NarL/FixJ family response regulator
MTISVLLVDDHTIIRNGLTAILKTEDDIRIVAEAGDGKEAISKVIEFSPDVVVMDLTLPDMGGTMATRRILAERPDTRVLILTMFLDETCVFESLEAGARGYLVKDCASEELVAAIRSVHQGKPYFCPQAQEIMMRRITRGSTKSNGNPELTNRESEVLKLTARGLNTKEIAYQLGVSVKMIEVHRMNVKRKLGLNGIAQLTAHALKTGLIAD